MQSPTLLSIVRIADGNQKIGILIDNIEPAIENGKFISEYRRYVEFLRMLTNPTVQSVTLITSREPLHEEGIFIDFYPLKELSAVAWNEYLKNCHINTGYDPYNKIEAPKQVEKVQRAMNSTG